VQFGNVNQFVLERHFYRQRKPMNRCDMLQLQLVMGYARPSSVVTNLFHDRRCPSTRSIKPRLQQGNILLAAGIVASFYYL